MALYIQYKWCRSRSRYTLTGKVDILKAVIAQDVGRAINPNMVEGQMDGGFEMALGFVLFEDLKAK